MYIYITKSACPSDINECAEYPCKNGGVCTDGVNDYSCACAAGWTGEQCTTGNPAYTRFQNVIKEQLDFSTFLVPNHFLPKDILDKQVALSFRH